MKYEDLIEFDTKLTADVVEWCPSLKTLACGTYFLDKEQNKRLGCIYTLNLNDQFDRIESINKFDFNFSGILDLKWLNESNLITIDSQNEFTLFEYNQSVNSLSRINNLNLNQETENASIGLTVDFLNRNSQIKILTSDTLGYLSLIKLDNERSELEKKFKAHDLETWCVLLDRQNADILYSGADDSQFKMWDLRSSDQRPAGKCSIFDGGVTNILYPCRNDDPAALLNGYSNDQILCSSYDERIYVLDKRNMRNCLKKSAKLGGGVWKMKLHSNRDILLLACMHYGVNIVNIDNFDPFFYYDKHGLDNLVYGCDWNIRDNQEYDIVASCSFYNHSLRLWKFIHR
jgi:diphthine methyl ester acylhydrolase